MLKIVFLSPSAQLGGAETVLIELLGALREARPPWSLHLIAAEEGPLLEKAEAMGVACELLPFPTPVKAFGEDRQALRRAGPQSTSARWRAKAGRTGAWILAGGGAFIYAWQLRQRLRHLRPDIVHSNGMKMHLLGALAKSGPIPLVWHLHDYLRTRPAMLPLLRPLAKRCQMIVANSESVADDVRRALPAGPPVHAVHNAVDPEKFTPKGDTMDLDRVANMPPAVPGTLRVGLVATFALWKGHEVFLRAAALVAANGDLPVRFYIVGGPVYATRGSQHTMDGLRARAADLGIGAQVGFTGFVPNAASAMRALDVVVHASTEPEPFGLVIIQAMACGRALVASGAGGARELLNEGTDALVHEPGDAVSLAKVITRLIGDPELRARLGKAGRSKVARDFSPAKMAKSMVALYEQSTTASRS